MIPSRPLRFSDIFSETFAIATRIFPRYTLFFLICIVPATWLMTEGMIDGATATFRIAQHRYGFTDEDLTAVRNHVRDSLAQNNPAFRREVETITEERAVRDSTHLDSVIRAIQARPHVRFTDIVVDNIRDIVHAAMMSILGGILWLIGLCILLPAVAELAVQVFEQRRQRVLYTIKNIFRHHLWSVLGIVLLYGMASFALWVLSIALGEIRNIGGLFSAAIFVVWCFASLGFSVAVPAAVSENRGPIASLKRSWQLTKGSKWRIFGGVLALCLVLIPLALFLMVVTSAVFMSMSIDFWRHALRDPIISIDWVLRGFRQLLESSTLANNVIALFVMPLPIVFAVVFYYDLRTRLEGPLTYDEPEPAAATPLWQP